MRASNRSSHGEECSMQILYWKVLAISISILQSFVGFSPLLVPEESCNTLIVSPSSVVAD